MEILRDVQLSAWLNGFKFVNAAKLMRHTYPAWHQGVDLYGESDNRLLKGFEYTARYNLGEDVPFVPCVDTTGKYRHQKISTMSRRRLRPVYEMVWNHYQVRRGIPAPFTKQAADKIRPEGAFALGDHPGFGTFFFAATADDREVIGAAS